MSIIRQLMRALLVLGPLAVVTPATAGPHPIYRDSMVICTDGSRVSAIPQTVMQRPDEATMNAMCSRNAADRDAAARDLPRITPSQFGFGILTCPGGATLQLFDWRPGDVWSRERLAAKCGRPASSAPVPLVHRVAETSVSPALPTEGLEERFRKAIVPLAPIPVPPDLAAEAEFSRKLKASVGPPLFYFTKEEAKATFDACFEASTGKMTAEVARSFCQCSVSAYQAAMTRAEFNAFLDYQVWKATWRRHFWTVEEPKGAMGRVAAEVFKCKINLP